MKSQIVDDGIRGDEHEYNASLSIQVSVHDFNTMKNISVNLITQQYSLKDFNCTDYAIAVFNEGMPVNNKIIAPDWIVSRGYESINYGSTPNGLYRTINTMKTNNASTATNHAPTSTVCN